MKRFIAFIITASLLMLCLASCDNKEEFLAPALSDIDLSSTDSIEGLVISESVTDYVLIEVEEYGKILIRLFPEVAPTTVANFKSLVANKFYDGLIFHRVIDGFMAQCGGYTPDMEQKKADTIKGEFTSNGFTNNLIHLRGVVSMARTDIHDSATSQFFIVQKTSSHLDGQYAAFGYTVYGIEVVDDIVSVGTDSNDQPRKDIVIKSIRFADVSELTFK